ncbi:MAG: glycosyltransferase N-terminal domain-containing protein [Pseudomonadota bacterium]
MGAIFRRRARAGKEDAARINERFAKELVDRPNGPLIWFHAASVGESQLQLELARRLIGEALASCNLLFTCQTQTAAKLVTAAVNEGAFLDRACFQQMAPVDTQRSVQRFLNHWKPNIAVVAEGEIWPNTLLELHSRDVPAILINARMTEKSILGWMRWPETARKVFSSFDLMIAADVQTQTGLSELSGREVICPGNLKSALPAPTVDEHMLQTLRKETGERPTLLAASTHAGEEALIIDAWMQLDPKPFLIIAPRHPDRGDEVDRLLSMTRAAVSRRSEEDPLTAQTEILLADTMGEMGLWYRLADTVYLGGGHAPGVGGHNPLEALQLGKPVVSGPSVFNFRDLSKRLLQFQGYSIVHDVDELISAYPALPVSEDMSEMLKADALGPMSTTLQSLAPILQKAELAA